MIALVFSVALAAHAPADPSPMMIEAPKPEKIRKGDTVCRREAVVGSRMPKRICMTQAEWIERKALDRREVEKVQNIQPI
jgi:hypothetical protein